MRPLPAGRRRPPRPFRGGPGRRAWPVRASASHRAGWHGWAKSPVPRPPYGRPSDERGRRTTMTATATWAGTLDDEMLARFEERAPGHDRDNTFAADDLDELRACGYLLAAVPADLGGGGLDLAEA